MSANQTACDVAFERGIQRIFELCEEEGETAGMEFASKLLGVGEEPDPDCEAALEEGLNEETCQDFRGIRQWVLCRVFNAPDNPEAEALLSVNDGDFESAMEQAWDIAQTKCGEADVDV